MVALWCVTRSNYEAGVAVVLAGARFSGESTSGRGDENWVSGKAAACGREFVLLAT